MASVTLEVKINNQSCKQRKRRGRSWGKQVTKEKHIIASKVKQKRVTDRWVQPEVLIWGANHTLFSRMVHWERAQRDFSTCSFMARPVGDLFTIFSFGVICPFPTCTHYLLLTLHSHVRVAEQRWIGAGEGHATALEHPRQAMPGCLPYQAVLPRGKWFQPTP